MLKERLGKELLFFDGGTGTSSGAGLAPGELPETWNLTHREEMTEIHRQYFAAGSDIVLTNTFGANALKYHDPDHDLAEVIRAAVENVKAAACLGVTDGREVYAALDMGPTGKLLKPMGDLDFEEAYEPSGRLLWPGSRQGRTSFILRP